MKSIGRRIGIQTWGSTGDCRPFHALALALKAQGFDVCLKSTCLTGNNFERESLKNGIEFESVPAKLPFEVSDFQNTFGSTSNDLILLIRLLKLGYFSIQTPMLHAARALARDCDLIIGHFLCHTSRIAAEEANKKHIAVHFWPGTFKTRAYPPANLPNLGRLANPILWNLAHRLLNAVFQRRYQELASQANLKVDPYFPSWWQGKDLTLIGCSPSLWNPPSDWSSKLKLTGFWDINEHNASLPYDCRKFLDFHQQQPLLLSFGSMGAIKPEQNQEFLNKMAQSLNVPVLLQCPNEKEARGWDGNRIYRFHHMPHQALFKHIAGVVHHGGAGTTHSVMQAGLPAFVISFCEEQHSFGTQIYKLGAGPKPMHRRKILFSEAMFKAEALANRPEYAKRARQVAQCMHSEDGIKETVQLIKTLLNEASPSCE